MQRRLDIAGNPKGWTSDRMLAVKGLGLVALGMLGALYGLRNPELLIVGAGLGAVIGFFLPDLLLYNTGLKRQQQIPVILPDALDMLTNLRGGRPRVRRRARAGRAQYQRTGGRGILPGTAGDADRQIP